MNYLVLMDRNESQKRGRVFVYTSLKLTGEKKTDNKTLLDFIISNEGFFLQDYMDAHGDNNITMQNKNLVNHILNVGLFYMIGRQFDLAFSKNYVEPEE